MERVALWTLNSYSYVANCKPAALGLLEILCFELFSYIFLHNYLCALLTRFPKASHIHLYKTNVQAITDAIGVKQGSLLYCVLYLNALIATILLLLYCNVTRFH